MRRSVSRLNRPMRGRALRENGDSSASYGLEGTTAELSGSRCSFEALCQENTLTKRSQVAPEASEASPVLVDASRRLSLGSGMVYADGSARACSTPQSTRRGG